MTRMKFPRQLLVASLLCVSTIPMGAKNNKWTLTWSDEFNGTDGSQPDPSKWEFVTGGRGFGNNELQAYTARPENAHLNHGTLVITARRENFTAEDGIPRQYTSPRLQTKGKFSQRYGRFEARIRIPRGQGIWPAFWMLGNDIDTVGWPKAGEIDIMENVGKEPGKVHGSLHGPRYSGGDPLTGAYTLPDGKALADQFHVYAVEWEPDAIRFYIDNHLYETQTPDSIPEHKKWVFNHPFFLLLNCAVGGKWPGNPDDTTTFPQQMLVDYVRVYARRR
ncbi:MAG: glycoside hydrolase family 16 protein [Terriglobus sp.]